MARNDRQAPSFALEVANENVAFAEQLLNIPLPDDTSRVSVEIDADSQLDETALLSVDDESSSGDNSSATIIDDSDDEADSGTTLDDFESDTATGTEETSVETTQTQDPFSDELTPERSPTDTLVEDDSPDIPEPSGVRNFNTPDELPDVDVATSPGTQTFHIMALLYRLNDEMDCSEVYEYLTGTDWEIPRASVSGQLSNLKTDGLVEKEDARGGNWWLTELGKQYVQGSVYKADEYPLEVADDIAGINSPSSKGNLQPAD